MNTFKLIARELMHGRINTALVLVSILVAVAGTVGAFGVLKNHDRETAALLKGMEDETIKEMKRLEDDIRKSTKKMGFNIHILPKEESLRNILDTDEATHFMPESYGVTLAEADIVTITHLLPSLRDRVLWTEKDLKVILYGVKDELTLAKHPNKKPLLVAPKKGTLTLGYQLHKPMKINEGDTVVFNGQSFTVAKGGCKKVRYDKRDFTVTMHLEDVQGLLNKPNLINGIQALECRCAFGDLEKVRAEVEKVLPETQVIEYQTIALQRAEARKSVGLAAKKQIQRQADLRSQEKAKREKYASILVGVLLLTVGPWVALLGVRNVRDRSREVAILRTVGFPARRIQALFLGKSAVLGLAAGLMGYFLGHGWLLFSDTGSFVFSKKVFAAAVLAAPLLSALAGWVPAQMAARQDPAGVLRKD